MQRDDQELEKYLRAFRPREIRALEPPRPASNVWLWRLAAGVLLFLSVGAGIWHSVREVKNRAGAEQPAVVREPGEPDFRPKIKNLNSILLTKLALENDSQFSAELEAESRQVLPDFQGSQSTLSTFAKE